MVGWRAARRDHVKHDGVCAGHILLSILLYSGLIIKQSCVFSHLEWGCVAGRKRFGFIVRAVSRVEGVVPGEKLHCSKNV